MVVEHDPQVMVAADELLGDRPRPGERGGDIVARHAGRDRRQPGFGHRPWLAGKKRIDVDRPPRRWTPPRRG